MAEPLFRVSNHHTEPCGTPPAIDGDDPGVYVGYFANDCGEQGIYTFDRRTGEAALRLGDADWTRVYRVVDGEPEGLILGRAEALWLQACWLATGAHRRPAADAADV